MNTRTNSMQQQTTNTVLAGIDPGMNTQRVLPLSAVLRVMEPLIQRNDPSRAPAFALYAMWLNERDVDMPLSLAAEFWENFLMQFTREIPVRCQQWAQSINAPGLRSPLSLLAFAAKIADQWAVPGLKHRMCQTQLGKCGYMGLSGLTLLVGLAVVVPTTLYLATIGLRVGSHVLSALRYAPQLLGF